MDVEYNEVSGGTVCILSSGKWCPLPKNSDHYPLPTFMYLCVIIETLFEVNKNADFWGICECINKQQDFGAILMQFNYNNWEKVCCKKWLQSGTH